MLDASTVEAIGVIVKTEGAVKAGLIQHKIRPPVKRWIEEQAKAQDRSQAWFVSKIVEDAFMRHQQVADDGEQ